MHPHDIDDWRVAEHITEDLIAEGVPPEQLSAAFAKRKAEIEAAIHHACAETDVELRKNPDAGRDYLASRFREMERE